MLAYMLYGFTEDAWHGRNFVAALKAQDIHVTDDVTRADYVIAHSGGCFTIPELSKNQVLLMIDPPYWPGRSVGKRARAMITHMIMSIRPGNRPFHRLHVNLRHTISLILHPLHNARIIAQARNFNLEEEAKHANTILVRNRHDPWLGADLAYLQDHNPHLALVHLPGDHLHCWEEPEDYIHLLRQYKVVTHAS